MRCIILVIFILLSYNLTYAATYWVRPYTGEYGAEDGSNYAAAFDGLEDMQTSLSGMSPGDTIYICGVHTRLASDSRTKIEITAEGAANNPITFRMDCSAVDESYIDGVFTSLYSDDTTGGYNAATWDDCSDGCPDGAGGTLTRSGVYYAESTNTDSVVSKNSFGLFEYFNDMDDYAPLLKYDNDSADDVDEAGEYYIEAGESNNTYMWVYPADVDNLTNDNLMFTNGYGYIWLYTDTSHLRFEKCNFVAGRHDHGSAFEDNESGITDITFIDSTFLAWEMTRFWGDYSNIKLIDNEWNGLGYQVGFFYPANYYGDINDITIRGNYVHNGYCNTDEDNCDGHAIGLQGNTSNVLIEENYIKDFGSGIVFWHGATTGFNNVTVRFNYLENMDHDREENGSTRGSAIVFQCNNTYTKGLNSNIKIYGNVIDTALNCPETASLCVGIRKTQKEEYLIYNNTISGFNTSFYCMQDQAGGCDYDFRNNISLNPQQYHILFRVSGQDSADLTITNDYNVFYPSNGSDDFYFLDSGASGAVSYAGFNTIESADGRTSNANSVTTDPGLDASFKPSAELAGADVSTYVLDVLDPTSVWPDEVDSYRYAFLVSEGALSNWFKGAFPYLDTVVRHMNFTGSTGTTGFSQTGTVEFNQ